MSLVVVAVDADSSSLGLPEGVLHVSRVARSWAVDPQAAARSFGHYSSSTGGQQ